jgi:hypothetical protein
MRSSYGDSAKETPHGFRNGANTPAQGTAGAGMIAAAIVATWFAAIVATGAADIFVAGPSAPPLAVFAAIAVPPLVFAIAYARSAGVRAFVLGLDLRVLTAMQAWRVIGLVFLAFYAFDMLPGIFAWPAGLGDAAVAVGAIAALGAMLRQAPGWRRGVFWLNIAGLVDFAVAIATGVLTSNSAVGIFNDGAPRIELNALPMSLIPTFAVPFWIIVHTISLLQLRQR